MLKKMTLCLGASLLWAGGCGARLPFVAINQNVRLPSINSVKPTIKLMLDADRDGILTAADETKEEWSWAGRGALVLPNLDDDDLDGRADCEDEVINGSADEKDLTPIHFEWDAKQLAKVSQYRVSLLPTSTNARARWFHRVDSEWRFLNNSLSLKTLLETNSHDALLAVESCDFATQYWDGFLDVKITDDSSNVVLSKRLRTSPFLMIPNTAAVESFFVSRDQTGRYENSRMIFELLVSGFLRGVAVKMYSTDAWQEMWMQDTMEIGYAESPTSRMHVVLNAARGQDRFGRTLLAPNVGYLEVAEPRTQPHPGDAWIDWFGNLEVSPPTEAFPHGRIYYGAHPETGNKMHPDVVKFLEAQELQRPFALDSGWLFIKHVDEMLTFWPDAKKGIVALMPSTALAAEILGENVDEFNLKIQEKLNQIIAHHEGYGSLFDAFGIEQTQLKFLPLMYEAAEHGAVGRWSNPINSVFMNGAVLYGRSGIPHSVQDFIKSQIHESSFAATSLDDSAYQQRLGNVHCATNSIRKMPKLAFWQVLKR